MNSVLKEAEARPAGWPEWLEPSLHVTPGRDPLGLQTITLDRIMPTLVSGVLVLSRRARYFTIYPFLLKHYEEHRLAPSLDALSDFIRGWEFEYAVSVMLCPRGCGEGGSGVVGSQRADPAARSLGDGLTRSLSIDSALGGYGLYYRSPLEQLGVVAPRGTLLGEEPIPIDVLRRDGRGEALASEFERAIGETEYYRRYMGGTEPIPRDVLRELSERCCLCRLDDYPEEQAALRDLFLASHDSVPDAEVAQRRASFGVLLDAMTATPAVAADDGAFREVAVARYASAATENTELATAYQQWAALALKEYMQEGISCAWVHFVKEGYRGQPEGGYSRAEIRELIRERLAAAGSIDFSTEQIAWDENTRTNELLGNASNLVAEIGWEALRDGCIADGTAGAGLVLLLAVAAHVPDPRSTPDAWTEIATRGAERQPGLVQFVHAVDAHLEDDPLIADTLEWLVARSVIAPHEAIAYSKLPEFTFRFRWEGGRLVFYNIGLWRFTLADPRRTAMSQIARDIGLWGDREGELEIAGSGQALVTELAAGS